MVILSIFVLYSHLKYIIWHHNKKYTYETFHFIIEEDRNPDIHILNYLTNEYKKLYSYMALGVMVT